MVKFALSYRLGGCARTVARLWTELCLWKVGVGSVLLFSFLGALRRCRCRHRNRHGHQTERSAPQSERRSTVRVLPALVLRPSLGQFLGAGSLEYSMTTCGNCGTVISGMEISTSTRSPHSRRPGPWVLSSDRYLVVSSAESDTARANGTAR